MKKILPGSLDMYNICTMIGVYKIYIKEKNNGKRVFCVFLSSGSESFSGK